MKLYIAMGTYEFLKKMKDAHPEQIFFFYRTKIPVCFSMKQKETHFSKTH